MAKHEILVVYPGLGRRLHQKRDRSRTARSDCRRRERRDEIRRLPRRMTEGRAIAVDIKRRSAGHIPCGRSGIHERKAQEPLFTRRQTDFSSIPVRRGDIVDPESNFKDVVEKFLGEFKMRPSQIDLVLDFRAIPRNIDPRIFALAVKSAITATPFIGDWRTFTLIESSFPEQLSSDFGFTADEISTASRTEWHIWKYLRTQSAEIARMPAFGDYGVFHPDPTAFDFIRMQMAAKIRYTSDEHWLIVKGRSTKDKGFEQYMKLAKMLIDHPEYKGRKFSPGDEYIYTRGNKSPGATCGNQTTWIEAGVSHHIAFVLHQLANLDAA
jgi:hypothetical protein